MEQQHEVLEVGDEEAVRKRLADKLNISASQPSAASSGGGSAKASTFAAAASASSGDGEDEDGPNIMEQMMAEAMQAQFERKAEKQRLKTAFGDGLKGGLQKGFLSGGKKPAKKRAAAAATAAAPPKATATANSNNNTAQQQTAAAASSAPSSSIPTLTAKTPAPTPLDVISGSGSSSGGSSTQRGVVLPEVQDAMAEQGRALLSSTDAWLTPALLSKIAARPALAAALQSPRFTRALELMRDDPRAAMALFGGDADARALFTELLGLLGTHFEELGAQTSQAAPPPDPAAAAAAAAAAEAAAQGPLAQAALRRHAEAATSNGGSSGGSSGGDGGAGAGSSSSSGSAAAADADVARILADEGLRELLVDPGMQTVLQECSAPGRLRHYAAHPEWGPKIRRLAQAGLVQIQ